MSTTAPARLNSRPISAPKAGEMIAAQIRAQIVRGELNEGDSLPGEVELMEQFDVSRPTLREAFRILETERLIAIKRGARGGRVLAPSVEVAARYFGFLLQAAGTTIGDLYQARSIIEPAAAGLLATSRTKQDIIALENCLRDLEEMVSGAGDDRGVEAWGQAAQRFHELVVDLAGNQTLALQTRVLHEVVATHLSVAVHLTFDPSRKREMVRYREKTVRSYRKLIDFIAARDSGGATQHWKVHMDVAGRSLLSGGISDKTVLDLIS